MLAGVLVSLCAVVVSGSARDLALDGLWPWPTGAVTASGHAIPIDVSFNFRHTCRSCRRLDRAFERYATLIGISNLQPGITLSNSLKEFTVEVYDGGKSCEKHPALGDNESYLLEIELSSATLRSQTVAGAIRGLETFSQLVSCGAGQCQVSASRIRIEDEPRFTWRGTMLDTARHFLPIDTILKMLDGMAYNKLNVLHWHVTDDQSFPLLLSSYPKLAQGAYDPELTYSRDDVAKVVAAATDRAIRVVPEFDSPGHASSWAVGYPELAVAECRTLDPTNEDTFKMLDKIVGEITTLFPDSYVHLGCDEVSFSCWNSSSKITDWMMANNVPRTDLGFKYLTARYIGRLQKLAKKHNRTSVVWQEAMDHYGNSTFDPTPPSVLLDENMIVEQWLSPVWNWANLSAITGHGYLGVNVSWPKGFRALTTNGWYLDDTAVNSWANVYAMEPLTNASCAYSPDGPAMGNCSCKCPSGPWRDGVCHCFDLRAADVAERVLGGEAPLWGEHIDEYNLFPRAFPRLSAVAERLWSRMQVNNATTALPRLEQQRCRMLDRGIEVTPLGPGFCRPRPKSVGSLLV